MDSVPPQLMVFDHLPEDPAWHLPALIAGVATTIGGFGVRYVAHLKQRREIEQTKREAERR